MLDCLEKVVVVIPINPDGLTLWYPERKFFLLEKKIRRDWLAQIPVPEQE